MKNKDRLHKMAKTDNFELCHQYLIKYLRNIKKQLNKCEINIKDQSQRCAIIKLSIKQIDHRLGGFVVSHRHSLTMITKRQLVKFNDKIIRRDLFQTMSVPTINNQVTINTFR